MDGYYCEQKRKKGKMRGHKHLFCNIQTERKTDRKEDIQKERNRDRKEAQRKKMKGKDVERINQNLREAMS